MSEGPSEENPFLSTRKVATMFDVHVITVRKWITDGKLKASKIEGSWRVLRSEVNRFATEKYGSSDGQDH